MYAKQPRPRHQETPAYVRLILPSPLHLLGDRASSSGAADRGRGDAGSVIGSRARPPFLLKGEQEAAFGRKEKGNSLVVVDEPLDRLVDGLLEGGELERLDAGLAVDQSEQLLVRRRLSELAVRLGRVKLDTQDRQKKSLEVSGSYGGSRSRQD